MVALNNLKLISVFVILIGILTEFIVGQNCTCPRNECCRQYGYCGSTPDFCGGGCQSRPCTNPAPPPPTNGDDHVSSVANIVTPSFFNGIIDQAGSRCFGKNFYSRNAFLEAVKSYPNFGKTGSLDDSKREIAAFFAHVTHETGHFCYKEEINGASRDYCDEGNKEYPCAPGKEYYGRGPIQISWNYNYGPAGESIGIDCLNAPETVANDAIISFKTAFWFWMNNLRFVRSTLVNATGETRELLKLGLITTGITVINLVWHQGIIGLARILCVVFDVKLLQNIKLNS